MAATGGAGTGGVDMRSVAAATVNSDNNSKKTNEARGLDMGHDYASSLRYPLPGGSTLDDGIRSLPDGVSDGFAIPSNPDAIHSILRMLRDDDEIRTGSLEDPIDNKYLLASDSRYGGAYKNISAALQKYGVKYFMIDAMKGNAFSEGLTIDSGKNVISVPTYLDGGVKMQAEAINKSLTAAGIATSGIDADYTADPSNEYTTYHLFKDVEHVMRSYLPGGSHSITITYAASTSPITVSTSKSFSLNSICKALGIPEPRKTKGGAVPIAITPPVATLPAATQVAAIKTLGDWSQLYRLIQLQNELTVPVLIITNDKFFLDICSLFLQTAFKPSFVLLTGKMNMLYCFDNTKLDENALYDSVWKNIQESFIPSASILTTLDALRTTVADNIRNIMSRCSVDTYLGYFIRLDLEKLIGKINAYLDKFQTDFVEGGALKSIDPKTTDGRALLQNYKGLASKTLNEFIGDMLKESFNIIETYRQFPYQITGTISPYAPAIGVIPEMGMLEDADGGESCAKDIYELLEDTFTGLTDKQKGYVYYYMIPFTKSHLAKFAYYRQGQVKHLASLTAEEVRDGFVEAHRLNTPASARAGRSTKPTPYSENLTYPFYSLMESSAATSIMAAGSLISDLDGLSAYTKVMLDPVIHTRSSQIYSTLMGNTGAAVSSELISHELLISLATRSIVEGKTRYNLLSRLVEAPKAILSTLPFWGYIYQGLTPPQTLAQVEAYNSLRKAAEKAAALPPAAGPRSQSRKAIVAAASNSVSGKKRSYTAGASESSIQPSAKRTRKDMSGGYRQHGGENSDKEFNPILTSYEMTDDSSNYTTFIKMLNGYYRMRAQNPKLSDENDFLESVWETSNITNATDFFAYLLAMASYLDEHAYESGILFDFRADLAKFEALIDYDDSMDVYNDYDFLRQVSYHLFNSEYLSYVFLNSVSNKLLDGIITKFLEIEKALADAIGISAIVDVQAEIREKFVPPMMPVIPVRRISIHRANTLPSSINTSVAPNLNETLSFGDDSPSRPSTPIVPVVPSGVAVTPQASMVKPPTNIGDKVSPSISRKLVFRRENSYGGARRRKTRRLRGRQQRRTRRKQKTRQHKNDMPIAE